MSRPPYIAVVGSGMPGPDDVHAEATGRLVAEAGAVLVTGGLGGVMEAASRGAQGAGGTVLGILPSAVHGDANAYCTVVVPTGLGEARNTLVVRCADAVVAVGGEWGTLSEIAFASKIGVPVVGLGTWELTRPGGRPAAIERAHTPAEAVAAALRLSGGRT